MVMTKEFDEVNNVNQENTALVQPYTSDPGGTDLNEIQSIANEPGDTTNGEFVMVQPSISDSDGTDLNEIQSMSNGPGGSINDDFNTVQSLISDPNGTDLNEIQSTSDGPGGTINVDFDTVQPRNGDPDGTDLNGAKSIPNGPGGTGRSEKGDLASNADVNMPGKPEEKLQGKCPTELEWFRSSDDVRTTYLQLTSDTKEIEYAAVDGIGIFEGDICVGKIEDLEQQAADENLMEKAASSSNSDESDIDARGVGITGNQFRWPLGIIPFEIDASVPANIRTIIENAINHWHENTLIRLRPRNGDPNFVRFISANGCWSAVGMRGGRQDISIGAGCGFAAAVHEIGHAVGLWHEQSREDRNNNVTVNWQNIQPAQAHNFNQQITDGDDIGAYDFDSIMHYGNFAFSSNNLATIIAKGNQPIGQRQRLSNGDIAAVNALYPPHLITAFPNLRYSALWNTGTQNQVWWSLCSEEQLRSRTGELWQNMRIKQMMAVVLNGQVRYACLWEPGTYGQVWWPNCTEEQLRAKTGELWSWARPAQVQPFVVDGHVRYSCLWNAGTHGQVWWPNCTEEQLRVTTGELWSWARPAQVQPFVVGDQIRYSCLWNAGTHGQVWWPNCTEEQFRVTTGELWSWARPAQVQPFVVGGQVRYSCLWNAGTHGQVWWPSCTEEQLRHETGKLWNSSRPAQWYPVRL
jgi:Astacin (Peptidase family M12A)